ncbi:hypothetical protein [Nostoc sp. MS1]|uniref:hypothetical protein n=1 Tax=Nostoc sp. MS1 TaxID=2764711 RepID=UPI0021E16C8D|nr:hypothetical protein [Nostoc sp. MS1]
MVKTDAQERLSRNLTYRQYLQGCANTKEQFLQAEANAKQQKVGFWKQSQLTMPWDFRRGRKILRLLKCDRHNNSSAIFPTQTSAFHPMQQTWTVLIFLTADLG